MNDVIIAVGIGIKVVVVIVQTCFFEVFRHTVFEHTERAAGFHAQSFDGFDDCGNRLHVFGFGAAPCRTHAETACAARFGDFGFFNDFIYIHHLLFAQIGVVVR